MSKVVQDLVYKTSVTGIAEVRTQLNKFRADETAAVSKMRAEAERNSRILRANGEDRDAGRVERRANLAAEISDLKVRTTEKIARDKENQGAYQAAAHAERRRLVEAYHKAETAEDAKFAHEAADAAARAKKLAQQEAAKKHGGDHEGGGHSIWSRVFQDQSTTGLDPLGRAVAIGAGGLAVGAVAVGVKVLADMTAKAVELRDVVRDGTAEWNAWYVEAGKSVPVLGTMVGLVHSFNELSTGEAHSMEIRRRTLEETVRFQEELYHWRIKDNAEIRERSATLQETHRRSEGVGLRGADASRFEFGLTEDRITKRADLDKKAVDDSLKENDIINNAQKRLDKWTRDGSDERFHNLSKANPEMMKRLQEGRFTNQGAMTRDERELAALFDQQSSLQDQVKAADKIRKGAGRKKEDIDAQAGGDTELNSRLKAFFETRRREQIDLEASSHAMEIKSAAGMTSAERERTAGNMEASRRKELETSIEDQVGQAKIAAQAKWNEASEDERVGIMQRLKERIATITTKGEADLAQLEKEIATERRSRLFETSKDEADALSAEQANKLRQHGEGYQAERVLRDNEHTIRIAEIRRQAAEEIAVNKDNSNAINRAAEARITKADEDFKENERQAGEREIAGRFGTTKELARGRRDELDLEARMGSLTAATDGKKLEIAMKYAEKRAEINRLIRDPNVMQAEKDLAKQQLAGLDAQEDKERRLSLFTGGGFHLAPLVIDSQGSGRAARITEEMSNANRQADFIAKGNSGGGSTQGAELAKAVAQLATHLRENANRQPPARSSHPGYNYPVR